MDFIDGLKLGEAADQPAATFAVKGADRVVGGEGVQEIGEGSAVEGSARWGGKFARIMSSEEVDGSSGTVEQRVIRGDLTAAGGDAAQGLAGLVGDGEGHVVGLQGGAANQQGIAVFAEIEQPLVILAGSPTGGGARTGGDFPVGGNREID
jgi:hypothetical protein